MKYRLSKACLGLLAGLALGLSAGAFAGDPIPTPAANIDSRMREVPNPSALYPTPAMKVDSGLGALPPYAEWREPWVYIQPAEKIDSGLGEITSPPRHAAAPAAARPQ